MCKFCFKDNFSCLLIYGFTIRLKCLSDKPKFNFKVTEVFSLVYRSGIVKIWTKNPQR